MTGTGFWRGIGRWATLALLAAVGPTPAAGLAQGRDFILRRPQAPWQAQTWPVVAVAAPPGADVEAWMERYGGLAPARGALLLVLRPQASGALDRVLEHVAAGEPVRRDRLVLVGWGETAGWAVRQAVARPEALGYVAIDPPVDMALPRLTGEGPCGVLLATAPSRAVAAWRVREAMVDSGATCVTRLVEEGDVKRLLGRALTWLLPEPPARFTLYDPVTRARLAAPPGWAFHRHDEFLAIARPIDRAMPVVEVAAGALGNWSFEEYVEATHASLMSPEIELIESLRMRPPDAEVLAHAFHFVDHREAEGDERSVYWILLGRGPDLVSFRCVAPRDELPTWFDDVRRLALSTTFDPPAR